MYIGVYVTISSMERPKREIKLDMARDSDKEGNFERRFFFFLRVVCVCAQECAFGSLG